VVRTCAAAAAAAAQGNVFIVAYHSDQSLDSAFRANAERGVGHGRVVHVRAPFKGYSSKWVAVRTFLASGAIGPDDVVVVVDGQDTLVNSLPTAVFRARARAAAQGGRRVVFAAEAACCVAALGVADTAYFDDDGSRRGRACSSAVDCDT